LSSIGADSIDSGGNDVAVSNPVTVLISNVRHEVGVAEGILPSEGMEGSKVSSLLVIYPKEKVNIIIVLISNVRYKCVSEVIPTWGLESS